MEPSAITNAAYTGSTFLWACVFIFALILSVLWILVPFAVFGIKGLLRRIARSLEVIEQQNIDLLAQARLSPRAAETVVYRDVRPDGTVVVREERTVPPA
ncbi:hypothetical protein HIV01_006720 [Lysobacter arenosi]|uniref:DUF4845 domain-containing protein n=1 Tax=Lysobacter arenosi TaxID=2795387 RepID=A0ABX7RHF3_9GAMM|nr:hypothetical protein [Lysobacter arenosi]QSX76906.1 hypothetical protein HIV01_006720 [Lysobacter arenosi]